MTFIASFITSFWVFLSLWPCEKWFYSLNLTAFWVFLGRTPYRMDSIAFISLHFGSFWFIIDRFLSIFRRNAKALVQFWFILVSLFRAQMSNSLQFDRSWSIFRENAVYFGLFDSKVHFCSFSPFCSFSIFCDFLVQPAAGKMTKKHEIQGSVRFGRESLESGFQSNLD